MAYGVEQDRLRAILPEGFLSLRPVLRINAEVRDEKEGYVEFNTAVERAGIKGWINIAAWKNVPFEKAGKTTTFRLKFLELSFTEVGIEGGCPAEKDNAGCFFMGVKQALREPEVITGNKMFCDCTFAWHFGSCGAHGGSIGKTLPAIPQEHRATYPKQDFTVENAAKIPCEQVLGSYLVRFIR